MALAIPAPAAPTVAIQGTEDRFPVRRIFCVGRNYAEHAREMGHDPDREPPFFFTKPADCVVDAGQPVPYPPQTQNLHHEAELVVAIGAAGRDIAVEKARDHIWGHAVGNDLTRRDLQAEAKERRRPWDLSKGFDNSAVVGPLRPLAEGHAEAGAIWLDVNGERRQESDLTEMIWPTADVIAFLSASIALAPGDLIMTGTPAGVGALVPGDICTVGIAGLGEISTEITA